VSARNWPVAPAAGDIVWCHFPDGVDPKPKARPALVLEVYGHEAPYGVRVVYGTSKRVRQLYRDEFAILQLNHPHAYQLANLSWDTKFNFRKQDVLVYTSDWFSVPPHAPHGQSPKLGTLHPSLMIAAQAAFEAS